MRRGTYRSIVALFLVAAPLEAQQPVRGKVLEASSSASIPIAGAMVQLRDPTGRIVQTVFSSSVGNFILLAPSPGTYQYHVAAIGYSPFPWTTVLVPDDGVGVGELRMVKLAMRLPDLLARGNKQFCGQSGLSDDLFARLLESARSALEIIEATVRSGTLGFEVEEIKSRVIYASIDNLETADTSYTPLTAWPIQSIPPDSLRRYGFMREFWDLDGKMRRFFYGPDARVLFAPWFLDTHCFSVAKGSLANNELKLHFKPGVKSKQVDISGVLTLNATTLAIETLEFSHENLPSWMSEHAAGGEMMFKQLPSGLWITTLWSIWGPIEGANVDARSTMAGVAETRGRVVRLVKVPVGK